MRMTSEAHPARPRTASLIKLHALSLKFLGLLLCAGVLAAGTAHADDTEELWPELNVYKTLSETVRLYLVAAYAQGKESDNLSLDLAGYIDITGGPSARLLRPIVRRSLRADDWRGRKYIWARIGYDHIYKAEGKTRKAPEDRGIVAVYGRLYLPAEVLLEMRTRADLRWIDGDYSTRYRLRADLNRDFTIHNHAANAYIQIEPFYDTRYDGWSRYLYQVGGEIAATEHFRVEPYVAWQVDTLPEDSTIFAIGLVAKWYY